MYGDKLVEPKKKCEKRAQYAGIAFGFSNFVIFGMYAADFYFGGLFQKHYNLSFFISYFLKIFLKFRKYDDFHVCYYVCCILSWKCCSFHA